MEEPARTVQKTQSPDIALIFSVLENEIMKGSNSDHCRKILAQENIWMSVDSSKQLQWARLAQMAGDIETALKVFTHITRHQPECTEAWQELLELLFILDRKQDLAVSLALAKKSVDAETYEKWRNVYQPRAAVSDGASDAALAPFEKLRRHEQLIDHYMKLFSGREDCFARQWADKAENRQGYVPVHRPLTRQDVEAHLSGLKTYGIYLLKSDATVATGVIDVDLAKQFRVNKVTAEDKKLVFREREYILSRIKELSNKTGLHPIAEYSGGKGFHFWFFFEPAVRAGLARNILELIALPVSKDVSAFHLEVFPKQDQLTGKGFGNLVKLPLGVHRLSGKRSFFIGCEDHSNQAQLSFLLSAAFSDPETLIKAGGKPELARIVVHPAVKPIENKYPELYTLESMCPPIFQVACLCRSGKGLAVKEERILYQTIGFLDNAKEYLHYLMAFLPDYNPHLVDFKLSRVRGTPMGCKRIHSLLNYDGSFCQFKGSMDYIHPLLHLNWKGDSLPKSEKIENLSNALNNLKLAIDQVERFL